VIILDFANAIKKEHFTPLNCGQFFTLFFSSKSVAIYKIHLWPKSSGFFNL